MLAEHRTVFTVVVKLLKYSTILYETFDGFAGGGITFVERCAIEQSLVCVEIAVMCRNFVCREDFQLGRAMWVSQEWEIVAELPTRGSWLLLQRGYPRKCAQLLNQ